MRILDVFRCCSKKKNAYKKSVKSISTQTSDSLSPSAVAVAQKIPEVLGESKIEGPKIKKGTTSVFIREINHVNLA